MKNNIIDIKSAIDFMIYHKDKIMDLFLMYQMVESLLFMKLHISDLSKTGDRSREFEELNKKMNSKTLGKLKARYLKKFPKDDYDLISKLNSVIIERNSFMHSLWLFLALWKDREQSTVSVGERFLKQYKNNASQLLDKIYELPN